MSIIDWSVLIGTLLFIVLYGTAKTKKSSNLKDYFLSDNSLRWWHIGLSVMATQASAITFISTPGQAYADGMGFIQFYFGLPLAMILVAAFFIPVYHRLRVFTAYEYLENRFNRPVRQFTAMLFLIQRGLAAGITIYAPSIILSSILSVDLHLTNISIGLLVIIYTVSGGAKAVSTTQQQQMAVMIGGLFIVVGILIWQITEHIGLRDAIKGA
ncbi:MAG: sodium:solute symporter, partial [Flavobacteriales bacterium]|nr:sodium:solute symporter [Flavobacteriales bacterium]